MQTGQPSRPPLDLSLLVTSLAGTRWAVELLRSTPSTNAVAAERVRAGAGEGLVVVTDHQTAGRGRLDRSWLTPEGSALTFSAVVAPGDVPVGRWPWLPLLTGVAVAEGVRRTTGLACSLKWPNDVLVGGAKVAGILVERIDRPGGAVAVVGVGINVTTTADELPVATATSLLLAGHEVTREELLVQVLAVLGEELDAWRATGGDAARHLRTAYLSLCATVGIEVRVDLPDGSVLTGVASGVDTDGRLEVTTDAGRTALLGAGDVVHVRPDGSAPVA